MESSSSPPIIRIFLSFNTLSSVRRNGQRRFRVRGGEERAGHFQSGVEDHEQRPERELESRCRPDISTERAPALDVRRISDLRPTRPKREPPLALFILVYGSFFFFFYFPSLSLSFSGFMEASGRRSRTHRSSGTKASPQPCLKWIHFDAWIGFGEDEPVAVLGFLIF